MDKTQPPKAGGSSELPFRIAEMVEAGLKQRFVVSHLREEDFQKGGLRDYARYRDLGIAEATNGMVRAHVIRFLPPCTDEVRKRHYHNVAFQMVYVLKGWIKNEFEGQGEHLMREGSAWIQPPGIRHTVLDYSADCEVLEIILPAEFETVEVASPATQTP